MADPTYAPWETILKPMGCSACGALVSESMTDMHSAMHAGQAKLAEQIDANTKSNAAISAQLKLLGITVKI